MDFQLQANQVLTMSLRSSPKHTSALGSIYKVAKNILATHGDLFT